MARASRPHPAAAPLVWRAAARLILAVVLLFPAPAACHRVQAQAAAPRDYTATSTRGARASSSNRARATPVAAAAAAAHDATSSAGIGGRMRVMEGTAVPDTTRVDSPSGRASATSVQYLSAYLFMLSPLPSVPPTALHGETSAAGAARRAPPWRRHIDRQTGDLGG